MRIRQHLGFILLMLALGLLAGPSHAPFTASVMAAPSLETSATFRLFHPVFVTDAGFVSTLHLYNQQTAVSRSWQVRDLPPVTDLPGALRSTDNGNNTELPMSLIFLNQWGGPVLTTNHALEAHSHFSLSNSELLNLSAGIYAIMAASSAPFSSVVRSLNPNRGQLTLPVGFVGRVKVTSSVVL